MLLKELKNEKVLEYEYDLDYDKIKNSFIPQSLNNVYMNPNNNLFYDSAKIRLSPNLYNNDILTVPLHSSINLVNGTNYRYSIRLWQDYLDIEVSKGKIQSLSSQTRFVVVPNVNIKVGMYVGIQGEARQITAYNSSTGEVTIESYFPTVISSGTDYIIISDFIDQFPEENLYIRNYPQVYITNLQTITSKEHIFNNKMYLLLVILLIFIKIQEI